MWGRCHGHGLVSLKALPIGRQRCAHAFQSSGRLATPSVATALRRRQQASLWARRQWPALRPSLRLRNRWILAHGVWYDSEPLVTAVRPPLCLSQLAFGPHHALCMTCHAQLLPRLALVRDPARLLIPLDSLFGLAGLGVLSQTCDDSSGWRSLATNQRLLHASKGARRRISDVVLARSACKGVSCARASRVMTSLSGTVSRMLREVTCLRLVYLLVLGIQYCVYVLCVSQAVGALDITCCDGRPLQGPKKSILSTQTLHVLSAFGPARTGHRLASVVLSCVGRRRRAASATGQPNASRAVRQNEDEYMQRPAVHRNEAQRLCW